VDVETGVFPSEMLTEVTDMEDISTGNTTGTWNRKRVLKL
jgi:hypothetical protein